MFKALKERWLCWWWNICYKHRRKNLGYRLGCLSCRQEHQAQMSAWYTRQAAREERIYQQLGVNQ
jgi:hypothetical protein